MNEGNVEDSREGLHPPETPQTSVGSGHLAREQFPSGLRVLAVALIALVVLAGVAGGLRGHWHTGQMPDSILASESGWYIAGSVETTCVSRSALPSGGASLDRLGVLGRTYTANGNEGLNPGVLYAKVNTWGVGPSVFGVSPSGGGLYNELAVLGGGCYYEYRQGP